MRSACDRTLTSSPCTTTSRTERNGFERPTNVDPHSPVGVSGLTRRPDDSPDGDGGLHPGFPVARLVAADQHGARFREQPASNTMSGIASAATDARKHLMSARVSWDPLEMLDT